MEHFNGPDGVEFGRRVPVQGHCAAMRLRGAAFSIAASGDDAATHLEVAAVGTSPGQLLLCGNCLQWLQAV
jgi:hypothetical protein